MTNNIQSLRVEKPILKDLITTCALSSNSNIPKSIQYANTLIYKYNLRSSQQELPLQVIANHIFNYSHQVNYICTPDGKFKTVDSLINRNNKAIWIKSLSNE